MTTPVMNEALMALRRRYAACLPAKVSQASECVESYLSTPGDAVRGEVAHRSVHSLIGSSGTYGFPDLSGLARKAETLIQECLDCGVPPTLMREYQIRQLLRRLSFLAAEAAASCAT